MTKPQVLLIDDDADICFMLAYFLESKGYKVKTMADGAAALVYLHQLGPKNRPDSIVMDWVMPEMNGKQLLAALMKSKDEYSRTSFIVMSGLDVERPLPAIGCSQDIVSKPFSIDRIFSLMKTRTLELSA